MSKPETAPPPIQRLETTFVPRLVVLDIDGTLVGEDLVLPERTRSVVRAAAQRMPVLLASGRTYRSALPYAQELGVVDPLVCYQGALVREQPGAGGAEGRVLFEEGLPGEVATRAVEVARDHDWHVQLYQDDLLLCDQDRPEARLYARIAQLEITFVDDLLAVAPRGTTKVACVSDDPQVVTDCVETMRTELAGAVRVTRSLPQFVEIVSPRVNKARALEIVCGRLGLRLSDAVACGDAPNDSEMLAAAGLGVAVRTARPEVLAVATAVCGIPEEAGVADVLEHLLDLG